MKKPARRPPRAEEKARRRRRDPEEARAEILAAAERLIAARGPDAVGLKDVAREVGVSHALVSHYFGTYENLVDEVLSRRMALLSEEIIRHLSAPDFGDEPGGLLKRFFTALNKPGHMRLVAWAMLSGRLEGPDSFPARSKGLRAVSEALHARRKQAFEARGLPEPSFEETEHAVLTAVAASYGYAIGKGGFLPALGRAESEESDAWFRERLGALILGHLAPRE